MKNTSLKYLLLAGVVLFGFAPAQTPSQCDAVEGNLIWNCGWETNCWAEWHPTAPMIDVGRDGFSHTGDYYGIIQPHPGIEWVGVQEIPVEPGRSYTFSFWLRNAAAIERLQVVWSPDRVDQLVLDLQNVPATEEYTQFVVPDLRASSDNTEVWIGFANSGGDVAVDDVVLVPSQQ